MSEHLSHVPKWMDYKIRMVLFPSIPAGAMSPGIDISIVQDESVLMEFAMYTTFHPIHGLLTMEKTVLKADDPEPVQRLCFFGYRCTQCNEVFLVPDSVNSKESLIESLKHGCVEVVRWDGKYDR